METQRSFKIKGGHSPLLPVVLSSHLATSCPYEAQPVPISPRQVDAHAAYFGRQQENEDRGVVVEVVYQTGPLADGRRAIHPVVSQPGILDRPLHDVQHLLRLCEEQGSMPL